MRPVIRTILIVLIPLLVVANLIADGPNYADIPVLGTINDTWDAFYEPLREGITRTYEQFKN